jgi:glycosyltransferase involved in cell wall biosynthesis
MSAILSEWQKLNVILAHDWLTGMRGGERVLEYVCHIFPRAPIYTLFYDSRAVSAAINSHPIRTSWLQHIPGILKYYRNFLPFFPSAMESMRAPKVDLIISTSHCVAKGLIPPPGARHLCYCFTPMRYAWVFYDEYFGVNPLKKAVINPVLNRLRQWDKESSARVNHFVTLSRHVQARIKRFYGREAEVVYPPIDMAFWKPAGAMQAFMPANYDLIVSALVPYKRIDIAVSVYTETGHPLIIVGPGTETRTLKKMAGKNIIFLGRVADEQLLDLYRHCRVLIFPGEEDFGLTPLEAQACGKPVVAYAKGGVLESVVDGETGVFFQEQNKDSLLDAVKRCAAQKWDSSLIRKNVERFSRENFEAGIKTAIEKCLLI